MKMKSIAALSMRGGKKDKFYFCRLEYFEAKKRWFLRNLMQVQDQFEDDEEGADDTIDGDLAIHQWIDEYQIEHLVVDFPLSPPTSMTLDLGWPNTSGTQGNSVQFVREKIKELLEYDENLVKNNPKQYERDRNKDDEISYGDYVFKKHTKDHILSRSFKRKLKRGFIPYWNRTLDFWIWTEYYDQLLEVFNVSYDSFGNTGLIVLFRFNYLRKKFPDNLKLYEANSQIILLELLRNNIITKRDVFNMKKLEEGPEAKLNIIKAIEKKLDVFIYDNDLEVIIKNPRAFDSFLISVAGMRHLMNESVLLPDWTLPWQTNFLVPSFRK